MSFYEDANEEEVNGFDGFEYPLTSDDELED